MLDVQPRVARDEAQSGEHPFFTGFVRDLTERQAVERRFLNIQADLAHVSRLSAMGEMASALAHELNQPLSATANYMKGSVRFLNQDPPDIAKVRHALEQAGEQTLRAGQIIRRLRDFVAKGEPERRIEKLLVVDDDPLVRRCLCRVLRSLALCWRVYLQRSEGYCGR